jgi:hypothetical protein
MQKKNNDVRRTFALESLANIVSDSTAFYLMVLRPPRLLGVWTYQGVVWYLAPLHIEQEEDRLELAGGGHILSFTGPPP